MRRPVLRSATVAALTAVLVGVTAPSIAGGELPGSADALPPCPTAGADLGVVQPDSPESGLNNSKIGAPGPAAVPGSAAPAAPPGSVPTTLPSAGDPTACQARPTRVEPAGAGQLPIPRPGYHHLGATTVDEWSAVLGRLTVRDPTVRTDSYDFVATRFMAKRRLADGKLGWLEVGWAETGWSGNGAQRIYTFDSKAMSWVFYDGYEIADGDQVWIYLNGDPDGTWRAWLWWAGRWHLLAAADAIGSQQARLEQYVEVHLDRQANGPPVAVPPIGVDRVRVAAAPGSPLVGWQADTVPTSPLLTSGRYCLSWENEYDIWSAGDCAATVQR